MDERIDIWSGRKKLLNSTKLLQQCHDREVWITSVGVNIGNEIFGKGEYFSRPVLVLKRCNTDTFIGVPLTKTTKSSSWYVPLFFNNMHGSVNLSQIRLFDQKRLLRLVGRVDSTVFREVRLRMSNILGNESAPL